MPCVWQSLGLGTSSWVTLGSLETNGCYSSDVSLEVGIHPHGQGAAPACSVQVQLERQEDMGDEKLEGPDCICAVKTS